MALVQSKQQVVLPNRLANKVLTRDATDSLNRGATVQSDRGQPWYNEDVTTLRQQGNLLAAVRLLARVDPTMSGAVWSFVQMAMSGFRITAYNSADHQYSPEGTQLARTVLASFDTLYDYSQGYSERRSVKSTLETMLRETVTTGGVGLELVLNKARLPDYLKTIPLTQIEWVSRGAGKGKYPQQVIAGSDPIPLDVATFWVAHSHEDAGTVYSRSMMESAMDITFHFNEFLQDVRRVVKRSGHDRLTFILNHEKVVEAMPREYRQDAKKQAEYLEMVRSNIETLVAGINPEDAIVTYDIVKPELLRSGQGVQTDYSDMLGMLAGLQSSGVKTPPAVLGLRLGDGGQSAGNIESLLFVRVASAIQAPVEEVMSRALTLSCRLYGQDVYVKLEFKPIDLRPESELAAFHQMRRTDILRLLSLGFYTDEYAAHLLDTGPRPPDAPELSGTYFMDSRGGDTPRTTPGDTPAGKALAAGNDTPRNSGGASQDRGGKR